jgi:hypothetical protein
MLRNAVKRNVMLRLLRVDPRFAFALILRFIKLSNSQLKWAYITQHELMKHHWDTFCTEPLSIAQGGKGVIVPGCVAIILSPKLLPNTFALPLSYSPYFSL